MKLKCYEVPNKGKDVCFDNNFSIHVSEGFYYVTAEEVKDGESCGYILMPEKPVIVDDSGLAYIDDSFDGEYFKISKNEAIDCDDEQWAENIKKVLSGTVDNLNNNPNISDVEIVCQDNRRGIIRFHQHISRAGFNLVTYNSIVMVNKAFYMIANLNYGMNDKDINDEMGDSLLATIH